VRLQSRMSSLFQVCPSLTLSFSVNCGIRVQCRSRAFFNTRPQIGQSTFARQSRIGISREKAQSPQKKRIHRRGTEIAEFGAFFDQEFFPPRPRRLRGEFSVLSVTEDRRPRSAVFGLPSSVHRLRYVDAHIPE
jgi:hypothetical protein